MSTILLDMTVHIPVLAGELIDVLDPRPGQVAIDCTFGGGGHARLVAQRLGASGTLVAIDRDPVAEERFAELAEELPCTVRFIRGDYAEALELLAGEGLRADSVYFDLGMSSMQVDTRERGFSYSYDAPLDMRMDPEQELDAREILAIWDQRRLAAMLRELGEERHAGAIARAIVRRREREGADSIRTTQELVEIVNSAIPAPARFAGGTPPSGSSRRCGSRSTTSSGSSIAGCRSRGGCCVRVGCWPGSPSIRWRTGASSASWLPVRRAASARPTYRCVPAGAPRRRRCFRAARSSLPRASLRTTRVPPRRDCAPRGSSRARKATPRTWGPQMTPPPVAATAPAPAVRPRRPARHGRPRQPARAEPRPRRISGPTTPARRGWAGLEGVGSGSVGLRWGGMHLPVGAGLHLPDRLLDRLIGGRAWIAVIAFALIGIVGMQLWVVKLGVGIGRAVEHTQLLQQENSVLSAEDSALSSGERIERLALAKGMVPASPAALHFDTLRGPLDARLAAAALAKPIQAQTTPSSPVGGATATTEASAGSTGAEASSSAAGSESSSSAATGAATSSGSTATAGTEASSAQQTAPETIAPQAPTTAATEPAPTATGGGSTEAASAPAGAGGGTQASPGG